MPAPFLLAAVLGLVSPVHAAEPALELVTAHPDLVPGEDLIVFLVYADHDAWVDQALPGEGYRLVPEGAEVTVRAAAPDGRAGELRTEAPWVWRHDGPRIVGRALVGAPFTIRADGRDGLPPLGGVGRGEVTITLWDGTAVGPLAFTVGPSAIALPAPRVAPAPSRTVRHPSDHRPGTPGPRWEGICLHGDGASCVEVSDVLPDLSWATFHPEARVCRSGAWTDVAGQRVFVYGRLTAWASGGRVVRVLRPVADAVAATLALYPSDGELPSSPASGLGRRSSLTDAVASIPSVPCEQSYRKP